MAALLICVGLGLILAFEEAGLFFIPGDISLIAAGVHGREAESLWFLPLAVIVATLAMSAGATILFHGVQQSGRFSRVLPERARSLIQNHGAVGIFGARVLPGLRNATVFAAASSRLSYRTFVLGLVPAAALWSSILLLLGWLGGSAMLLAFHTVSEHPALKLGSSILMIGGLLLVAYRFWSTRHDMAPGRQTPEQP